MSFFGSIFGGSIGKIAGAALGNFIAPGIGGVIGGALGGAGGSALGGSIGGSGAGAVGAGGTKQKSATGINALPPAFQNAYNGIATQGSNLILNDPAKAAAMYTPLDRTPDEMTADSLSQPMDQSHVASMASDYMNPFHDFLMQNIKNKFQGENSIYQNEASGSGFAPGMTNRDFLNTGYLQGQEELAAGNTMAGEYSDALGKGLTQQQLTIQNLLGQGGLQRGISAGTRQAPMTALTALGTQLGLAPSTSQSSGTITPNQLPNTSTLASGASSLINSLFGGFSSGGGGGGGISITDQGPIYWN